MKNPVLISMKIISLQISNILSFRFVQNIEDAEKLSFDDDLNIIIGENGSGKSTALEVINFLFRRVLYKQFSLNQDLYTQRNAINTDQRRQVLLPANNNSYSGFRLDPNWNTPSQPQIIRIVVKLDQIDTTNIRHLLGRREAISQWVGRYTTHGTTAETAYGEIYTLDIALRINDKQFSVQPRDCVADFGYAYLTDYNFFKEAISLYNLENADGPIEGLYESFTLISSYRNYHAFNVSISLKDQHPVAQVQQIRSADFNRSLNANDNSEPAIFALVRLRVAQEHFGMIPKKMTEVECEIAANNLHFIVEINKRLKIVNLKCKIKLIDLRTWQYSFEFFDLRRNQAIADINSLSAGQKAITHLVFEAYGRGDLKGGVVIIDEPEIHLHYQFQHEYLQVIGELNKHQNCQYILVTHSEALINSSTIGSVRRFSLNADGSTEIHFPNLTADQKVLIRILDNTRSTYAFFAKKVVLVEGDTDRFFFQAVLHAMHKELGQEIAILRVAGKNEFPHWTELFEKFGLIVYRIADLDWAYDLFYPAEQKTKLKTPATVAAFKLTHPNCDAQIAAEYANRTFILKDGDLEHYLGINKDLAEVIMFCGNQLAQYLQNDANQKSLEVREIMRRIAN